MGLLDEWKRKKKKELEEADGVYMKFMLLKIEIEAICGEQWLNSEVAEDAFQAALLESWNNNIAGMTTWGTKAKSKCRPGNVIEGKLWPKKLPRLEP